MRRLTVSSLTYSPIYGCCNPSALVNSASTPTLIVFSLRPTGRHYRARLSALGSTRNDEGPAWSASLFAELRGGLTASSIAFSIWKAA